VRVAPRPWSFPVAIKCCARLRHVNALLQQNGHVLIEGTQMGNFGSGNAWIMRDILCNRRDPGSTISGVRRRGLERAPR
jgi:hypothetical protein